jgi:lipoprotein-anchoring transpeptidase ErfK/SrfK
MSRQKPDRALIARRTFVFGAPLFLAACQTMDGANNFAPDLSFGFGDWGRYAQLEDGGQVIPALNPGEIDSNLLRQRVRSPFREAPGTIVVDIRNRFLYLQEEGGMALRYGVGVGRDGIALRGRATVGRKAEWPNWTPTARMIAFDPEKNGPWAGGMDGGIDNPLGARALYLYRGNTDTMFRIHGNNEPESIGQAVSSGCVRLLNHDIIDLYNRVRPGTPVLVV